MERRPAKQTKTTQAYDMLRRDIVSGVIAINQPIDEADVMARYQCGRTPIREALKRLELEQLVLWPPRRSPHIAVLNTVDQERLHEARNLLEGKTAALAADRISDAELEALDDLVETQERHFSNGDYYLAAELDHAFHGAIAAATHNQYLTDAVEKLNLSSLRTWHDAMKTLGMDHVSRDHRAIVEALRARDGRAARLAMEQHIEQARVRHLRMVGVGGEERRGGPAPSEQVEVRLPIFSH